LDNIILNQLITNIEFTRKVIPYLKPLYFSTYNEQIIFKIIRKYFIKYKNLPTPSIIQVALTNSNTIREETFKQVSELLEEIKNIDETFDIDWLTDNTETWAKDRALEDAIIKSVDILKDENGSRGKIQELISTAIEVNFDTSIGVDFFNESDVQKRWTAYHSDTARYSTGIKKLDEVTNGGLKKKCIHILLSGTHNGKTASKIAIGANLIRSGYDVLYVTMEMSEEEISQRFEANFMNIPINNIPSVEESKYKSGIETLRRKNFGKLIIKEYSPACITANHIRSLLDELRIKKKFKPQILIVDQLPNMLSSRVSDGNSYTIVKAISEELRGVAVEYDVACLTSTQTNRGGQSASDLSYEDVGESHGLSQTADLLIAIISNEELREQNTQIWKSIKNRLSGIIDFKFPIKTAFEYCKLKDIDKGDEYEMNLQNNNKAQDLLNKVKQTNKLKQLKIKVDEDEVFDDIEDLMGD